MSYWNDEYYKAAFEAAGSMKCPIVGAVHADLHHKQKYSTVQVVATNGPTTSKHKL